MPNDVKKTDYFFNRELSWIRFNERVLEEAEDKTHPLLERLRFLTIFSSNMDEFFMIRVAGIKQQIEANITERTSDGLTPKYQLKLIAEAVQPLMLREASILMEDILLELKRKNIRIRAFSNLRESQKEYFRSYFREKVFPVLTPLAIDPAHPFPQLRGLGVNLLVELKTPMRKAESKVAVVQVPSVLPRFVPFPQKPHNEFILLEEVIEEHIEMLFPNMKVVQLSTFRVTRNADLDIAEEAADDLLKLIERELRKRQMGTVVRLEVSELMTEKNKEFLKKGFCLGGQDIYTVKGHLNIATFRQLNDLVVDDADLRHPTFMPTLHPQIAKNDDIFECIEQKDILLHHPYDSFSPVVELIQDAAVDPKVLAIKQTLYRTGNKSPILQALKEAAYNGKQVTALFELKARFDEENNIAWAKELERAGVNVVYGLVGLKTHCKMLLIIRNEAVGLRHYVHLSTGNYNEKTAQQYTDMGLMTCDKEIGEDVSELFNVLTGYSRQENWRKILVAPIHLREKLVELIWETAKAHSVQKPSHIKLQLNSLVDDELIEELYKASQKGVKIDLIVRGICCLIPGVEGLSENISVRSIVGRFLEHTRIYIFETHKDTKIYCASADWMHRNLNRRIEVVFPIQDPDIKEYMLQAMAILLKDNTKARFLQSDGLYHKALITNGDKECSAQHCFMNLVKSRSKLAQE